MSGVCMGRDRERLCACVVRGEGGDRGRCLDRTSTGYLSFFLCCEGRCGKSSGGRQRGLCISDM